MNSILVIDDQKDNLTSVKAVIETNIPNFTVLTTLSGEKGIEIAKEMQPNTILLDIVMPEMDGYQVCKQLKEDESTKHIPVILISAVRTDSKSRVKGLSCGADAFLSKPIDTDELMAQIKVMLRIKEAEDKLKDALKRASKAEEITHTGSWYLDLATNEVTWTEELYKMFGFDPTFPPPLLSESKKLFTLESWELFSASIANVAVTRVPYEIELETIRKDGSNGWIWVWGEAVTDTNGKIIGLGGATQDITERKKKENTLQLSEEKFRSFVEQASEGIYLFEMKSPIPVNMPVEEQINHVYEGFIAEANDSHAKMYGYSKADDIKGITLAELHGGMNDPDNIKFIKSWIEAGYRINGSESSEFDINRNKVWFSNNVIGYVENGYLLRIWGSQTDITERKLTEEILSDNQAFNETLLNTSPNLVYIYDIVERKNIYSNKGITKILGYTVEEILEMGENILANLIHPDDFKIYLDEIIPSYQTIVDNEFIEHEYRIMHKNGNWRWLSSKESIFKRNEDNTPKQIFGITSDITERKKAEGELKELEYNKRILFDYAPIPIWEEDFSKVKVELDILKEKGIKDHQEYFDDHPKEVERLTSLVEIIAVNEKSNEFYEIDNSTLLKTKLSDWFIEDSFDVFKKELVALANGLTKFETNIKVIAPRGDYKHLFLSLNIPPESHKTLKKVIVSFVDITDLKQAEEDLIHALNKATESDRLKSAFLTTMSHELRTPLNAIIGFSNIIDDTMPVSDIIQFNKTINKSGTHLLSIVEDLFDITLIETGVVNLKEEDKNLHSLLQEVHQIIQYEQQNIGKSHLDLFLRIPPESDNLTVRTDPSKLKQVLLNLLKNALKFTFTGSVNYGFKIDDLESKKRLLFYVEDTGIGIHEDNLDFIFERFRQVEETNTKTFGGAGIGLSISKKLVNVLGGEIWVESTEKKGSAFYFTIPYPEAKNVVSSDESKSKVVKRENTGLKNKTILVVEDDDSSYEFLKIILKGFGVNTIILAKNGEEAVRLCEENSKIDLVLMDINMPVMNGYEATKVIKAFRSDLTIIAQTAYAISGDREKSLEAGCDDYIAKPIKKEELLEKIEKFIK